VILAGGLFLAKAAYSIVVYKAYIWLPGYVRAAFGRAERVDDDGKHIIFLMADHYEPGKSDRAGEISEAWVSRFREIAARHRDSYGRQFQYTWFYPFDERRPEVLEGLAQAAHDGFGEVELHWHHPPTDSQHFPGMLVEALDWFSAHGVPMSDVPGGPKHFAFIHGLWALDGSQPRCGVNLELDILFRHGCYADFTFPSAGTVSQPKKINAIYYARDTDAPKSYDTGEDVVVGRPVDDRLMIFEGPLVVDWMRMRFDTGAVENYSIPTPERIQNWIDANVHVKGRPEWVFVKVYSHGIQSRDVILDRHLDSMLGDLERICAKRRIHLHYVTTREAYNIVKAAEEGKIGDPDVYREYRVPAPVFNNSSK
jgi:hypothetical protein